MPEFYERSQKLVSELNLLPIQPSNTTPPIAVPRVVLVNGAAKEKKPKLMGVPVVDDSELLSIEKHMQPTPGWPLDESLKFFYRHRCSLLPAVVDGAPEAVALIVI